MQKGKIVALVMAVFLVIGSVAPVVALVTEPEETVTAPMTEPAAETTPEPEEELSSYSWDMNGDGTEEVLTFTCLDNGDEAPGVVLVETWVGDAYCLAYLEGGYGVTAAKGQEDGSVIVAYYCGDFYSHEQVETARIRYADGELTVE